jgi:hypothetical protein
LFATAQALTLWLTLQFAKHIWASSPRRIGFDSLIH